MWRRPRVAFVVQRCGSDAIGGAERLCLETASHMAEFWDVEILTTCAKDYVTWKNEYPPGISMEHNVPIRRFPVDRVRDQSTFARLSKKLRRNPTTASVGDQRDWMAAQGPASGALGNYLDAQASSLDAIYFYSYLYATTYDNLPRAGRKAVLVSLAHDEWMFQLPMWDRIFGAAHRVICMTPEEEHLLVSRFGADAFSTSVIPVGVDEAVNAFKRADQCSFEALSPYALYVGRVDAAKNCDELIDDFIELAARSESIPKLLLMGPVSMHVPNHPSLQVCGPASEAAKRSAIAGAAFVVIPSRFESLSLVALESWSQNTAVLANGASSVLVGQCRRSGGGLWYGNGTEFQAQYATCLQGRADALGRQGKAYVEQCYRWEDVTWRHRLII